ncbi:hypothetical protein [Candidatus Marinarcus aquaticus]|uniref:Cytochrome c domain-containing protein n=1 Tax=Candidatus Marinarcus aquaticus TaxID=2044504 RepID=A0A4Q0XSR5_9BACT|nr:hypothetical protein [Candidatus Marinarcus aquaticus]RXJ58177.1 hypothetical protein CRV04_06625 [Candidatus Marinarcus aquaticus]
MLRILVIISFFITLLLSKDLNNPAKIYTKKCLMCHAVNAPENEREQALMAAPYITLAMKSVSYGVDAIEEPKNNKELRKLVIEHIEDYIFNPSQDKSYCEQIIFDQFRNMPSLKGFISQKEAQLVAPWIYDNFAPEKYKVEE